MSAQQNIVYKTIEINQLYSYDRKYAIECSIKYFTEILEKFYKTFSELYAVASTKSYELFYNNSN